MIKVENVEVWGFKHAIRGMRNPLNSWAKSDTRFCDEDCDPDTCHYQKVGCLVPDGNAALGPADLDLMQRLYRAGSEHRKYLRQIMISLDITAPFYWWKEFDTYKIGTTANSCSTMHKIAAKEFVLDDFSHEHLVDEGYQDSHGTIAKIESESILKGIIGYLNYIRDRYNLTKDKKYWWQLIQLLPTSYNQKRTITVNYENAIMMIKQRSGHKLEEWREFVEILKKLPWLKEITAEESATQGEE